MPKSHSWFNVQASADAGAGEVSIRGFIGDWGLTDADFIAGVQALGEIKTLNVRLNSRGGQVDHALSIFNFLKSHPAEVVIVVDGVAMSSGSIIAMAGDRIVMPANTVMMVHNPWAYAQGDAAELRKQADHLDTFETALRATYMARTGKTEDEIKALLDEETYMTAAEAVEMGFADEVLPIERNGAATAAVAFASALGIPAAVLAKIEAAEQAEKVATDEAGSAADDNAGLPFTAQATLAGRIAAACADTGLSAYAADIALDPAINDNATAVLAIQAAMEIVEMCAVAGQPTLASALIRRRATLADARTTILTARAEADEATHTDSHIPTPNAQSRQSAADVWAKVFPTRQ